MLTRGCPRQNHGFCITPRKDGCRSVKVADVTEFWNGQKNIILLDQNILACRDREELIDQLKETGARITFDGGTDIRYMNEHIIEKFKGLNVEDFHFAWDDPRENLESRFELVSRSGLLGRNEMRVYVLTNYWSTKEEDLYRIYTLRKYGFMPYVMIYNKQNFVDSKGHWLPGTKEKYPKEILEKFKTCQHMQRWCNSMRVIKTTPDFEDYKQYVRWVERGKPVGK